VGTSSFETEKNKKRTRPFTDDPSEVLDNKAPRVPGRQLKLISEENRRFNPLTKEERAYNSVVHQCSQLGTKNEELVKNIETKNSELRNLEEQKKKQATRLNTKIQALDTALGEMRSLEVQLRGQNNDITKQNEKLSTELNACKLSITAGEKEKQLMSKQLDGSRSNCSELIAELDSTRAQLSTVSAALDQRQNQYSNSEAECKRLQEELERQLQANQMKDHLLRESEFLLQDKENQLRAYATHWAHGSRSSNAAAGAPGRFNF
jgi:chromosome segregation ATPase